MIRILAQIWRLVPFRLRLMVIRISQKKFTVSVVAIIQNPQGEVLILDHFIRPGTTWGLPGGFIDSNEYPDAAIKRELKEETNLDLENLELVQIRTLNKHIEILYRADANGEITLEPSEIRDFGWFPYDSMPGVVSKVQQALIRKVLKADSRHSLERDKSSTAK